jgi:hypothetical protein
VALPQDSEHRVTDSVEILLFLIWQLLHWLLFGCKNSQKRPRATCGNAAGPNRRFHEPGHMGCRAVALPNSVRLDNRGNLACASRSERLGGYEVTSGAMLDTVTVKRSIIFI